MNNSTGTESAYRTLARELRTAILQQQFADGSRLPTEAELAERYQLSRQTVRRAFQDLVSEGLVYRIPGKGTFATRREDKYLRQFGSVQDLMGLSIDTELELITPLRRRVDLAAAGRLRLDSDVVMTTTFRRIHDGVPFCVTTVSLPAWVGRRLQGVPELLEPGSRSGITIIGLLDTRLDDPIAEAEQSITVATVPAEAAGHIAVGAGAAVLRIDRLYYDTRQTPVELAISHFQPEHYSYRVRLRRGT
jgi:DNA-binding GntR family transcriptional regulator